MGGVGRMILERIKEIKEAEKNAADNKNDTRTKVKKILASADEDGKQYLAEAVAAANESAAAAEKKAIAKADKILENAANDAKIKASAIKASSEVNVSAAVSMIISALRKEFKV